jgi:hypothetical protein
MIILIVVFMLGLPLVVEVQEKQNDRPRTHIGAACRLESCITRRRALLPRFQGN